MLDVDTITTIQSIVHFITDVVLCFFFTFILNWFVFQKRERKLNRRLKRALYKACANWAKSERYTEATWHGDERREELWDNVQHKCLKKAEEYK